MHLAAQVLCMVNVTYMLRFLETNSVTTNDFFNVELCFQSESHQYCYGHCLPLGPILYVYI